MTKSQISNAKEFPKPRLRLKGKQTVLSGRTRVSPRRDAEAGTVRESWRVVFITFFAPEEGDEHTTPVVVFSGVNKTPLPSGPVFTHAPSQAGRSMAKTRKKTRNIFGTIETLLLFEP
jgi:hypothetical protein